MMGETGQGYMSEEELLGAKNPNLTRTWGEYIVPSAWTYANLLTAEVKKKCPWYFTLKRIISERPNLVPVGLGNNNAEYDTSILPSNAAAASLSGDELKVATEGQEAKGSSSLPDEKGKKVTVKREGVTPAKRTRSQVDRIADTEIARLECKKAKFEAEQQRFEMLKTVATAKAHEKSNRLIRLAELNFEQEKLQLDHKYRLEMLKHGQIPPPSSLDSHDRSPTYPTTWHSPTPLPSSQPFSESSSEPSSQPYVASQPPIEFEVPSLESFPLQSSQNPHSERHDSPKLGLDLFDETAC